MTIKEVERRIRAIALVSSKFKIGETGLKEKQRLNGHPAYRRIKTITWSKNAKAIDVLESKMINKFINWKNNDNTNGGSAGKMNPESDRFILYVVYTLKKSKIASKGAVKPKK